MVTRYIGFVARAPTISPKFSLGTSAAHMRLTHKSPTVSVYSNTDTGFISLPNDKGIVIGNLFDRHILDHRILRTSDLISGGIGQLSVQGVLRNFWGNYTAIFDNQPDLEVQIIRDPSGQMPCYWLKLTEGILFASDIDLILESGLYIPEIDWSFLRRHLLAPDLRSSQTGLVGVFELLPGSALSLVGNKTTNDQIWSPWDYVEPVRNLSEDFAVEELRTTVTRCVQAQASCYGHVMLGLSGGLDSSVLAAALSAGQTPLTCLNMVTRDPVGDERHYARLVANLLDIRLLEAYHKLEDIDLNTSCSAHLPRPNLYALSQSETKTKLELAAKSGIDAFFSGIGGDNVFCFIQSTTPLLDRIQTGGLSLGAWRTAIDICDMTGSSLWNVGQMAFHRAKSHNPAYHWKSRTRFLHPSSRSVGDNGLNHAWLDAPIGALPGKAVHIAMLARIQGTLDDYPRDSVASQVHPLFSQPIIELCLRIPTWFWCGGGRDRSIVRKAFADVLPSKIIRRRTKGGPDGFAFQMIQSNRSSLAKMLLEGLLMDHEILDKQSLEEALLGAEPIRAEDYLTLIQLAEAESWVRAWSARRTQYLPSKAHTMAK